MFDYAWCLRFPAFYKLLGICDQLGFDYSQRKTLFKMGGMKALIKTSALILVVFILFEGPNTVLMATMDAAVDVLTPIHRYFDSDLANPRFRAKRSFNIHLSEKEVSNAKGFAEGIVQRLGRQEENLIWGNVVPPHGSSSYAAMVASRADDRALEIAKEAFINNKAATYLANKNCGRYGMSNSYCADQMSRFTKSCDEDEKCRASPYRSFEGTCNNVNEPSLGATYTPYSRLIKPAYDDGFSEPRGSIKRLPNPLDVSDIVKDNELKNSHITLAFTGWGNLVANDLSHTVANRMMNTKENIMCCTEYGFNLAPRYRHPLCMPLSNGHNKCFNYVRSMLSNKQKCQLGPAEQMNAATHFLDGSGIYGSTTADSNSLRRFKGGQLKVDLNNGRSHLPKSEESECHHNSTCYLTGEVRINLDTVSVVLHTVLVREHNRIATLLAILNPHWDDEKLYQEARRIVIAEIQHITYSEWLPAVLGKKEIQKQPFLKFQPSGHTNEIYNENIDPSVLNSFANSAIQFLISMVDEQIKLYDEKRNFESSVLLREAIMKPNLFEKDGIFDSFIRGLATQNSKVPSLAFSNAVTKYFYSLGNNSGMDALSLTIQRGRDHGLPPFVEFRKQFGFGYESYDSLSVAIPKDILNKLKEAYKKITEIDLFVGGMAERPVEGGLLGPVFTNIIAKQFTLTRAGDKYFYDNKNQPLPFTSAQIKEIKKISISRLFCDNGDKIKVMQVNAFVYPHIKRNGLLRCSDYSAIPEMNLKAWQEKW